MRKINKVVKLVCPECKSKNITSYICGGGVKIGSCKECYFEWNIKKNKK